MKTILVFLALLMSGASLHAAGAVHGRVYGLDETGACVGIVAGARIELKNAGGTVVASATSSGSGFYSISGLEAAPYRYTVKATGWRDENHERGFALPEGDTDYVHDFLLMLESGAEPAPPPPMAGQTGQSAVHGRVYGQDETGRLIGPLPGARIELLSGQGGSVVASATAATPSGYYEIKNLASADYAYRVSAAGFVTEDAGRGFAVPKDSLEYVHDFILTKPPLKKDRCDLAVLVVKLISSGKDRANDARLPVANAKLILQPSGNLPVPLNQPFVTDAKGECVAPMIGEGDYTVAIDAPECEPFTGVLKARATRTTRSSLSFSPATSCCTAMSAPC